MRPTLGDAATQLVERAWTTATVPFQRSRVNRMVFELIAVVCAGLFAGAALYVTFVEHPARLEGGMELAITEFGPSYRRGAGMQASLAALGLAAGLLAWIQGRGLPALIGGLLLGALIPFTLVVIFPTNKRLLDPHLDPRSVEAAALLKRWGRLHGVRSLAGTLAFLLLVWHLGR
jgi:Domain of unknown function (DUF1772)